jgi:phosphatidate cytidylyltransferase
MKKRILSTFLLWGGIAVTLYFGGAVAAVLLLGAMSTLALMEFLGLFEAMGLRPYKLWTLIIGLGLIVGTYFSTKCPLAFSGAFLAVTLIGLGILALKHVENLNWLKERLLPTLLGFLYVPYLLHFFVVLVKVIPQGKGLGLAVWAIAVAKFTDVGGLLVGSLIGKNRLAPTISPKKTWEGAVGGVLMAVGVGLGGIFFAGQWLPGFLTLPVAIVWAVLIAVISIFADLLESYFKRLAGVKDSGSKLPGIGGMLDLLDSLLFVGPVVYILYRLI